MSVSKPHTLKQFLSFTAVGAIGTTAHYIVLISLVQGWGTGPVYASSAGFVIGALINYFLNYRFTFNSSKSHTEAMTKFFIVAVIGAAINAVIMFAGTSYTAINYVVVQICATALVLFLNYFLNRIWTFYTPADSSLK